MYKEKELNVNKQVIDFPSHLLLLNQYKYKKKDFLSSYPTDFIEIWLYKCDGRSCIYVRFNWPKPVGIIGWNCHENTEILRDPNKWNEKYTDFIFVFNEDIPDQLNFFKTGT